MAGVRFPPFKPLHTFSLPGGSHVAHHATLEGEESSHAAARGRLALLGGDGADGGGPDRRESPKPTGRGDCRGDGDGEVGWHGSRAHRDNEFHGSVYEFNHANLYVRGGEADVSSFSYVPAFRDGRRNVQLALKLNF